MHGRRLVAPAAACLLTLASLAASKPPWAGGPPGAGHGGAGPDREVFHFLLAHRASIARSVQDVPGGVETLTESDDPVVTAKIREHVRAMEARLREGRPIHRRDPLFAALFANAARIQMHVEDTPRGVRVRETSSDAYTAKLIRAHAAVVSRFLSVGWDEVRQDHQVPAP